MKKELTLKLIDGVFDNSDTTDIILSMIDKKIEFNEMYSFRNLVKFNKKDMNLQSRIDELKKARMSFVEYVNLNKNASFKLESEINIKII